MALLGCMVQLASTCHVTSAASHPAVLCKWHLPLQELALWLSLTLLLNLARLEQARDVVQDSKARKKRRQDETHLDITRGGLRGRDCAGA